MSNLLGQKKIIGRRCPQKRLHEFMVTKLEYIQSVQWMYGRLLKEINSSYYMIPDSFKN